MRASLVSAAPAAPLSRAAPVVSTAPAASVVSVGSLFSVVLAASLLLAACCGVGATSIPVARADLEKHREAELDRAGAGHVAAIARPPFVVIATSQFDREDAVATIAWAGARLRSQLFDAEPSKPISVWVFGTEDEYRHGSSAALGIIPDTPYGFYSPCKRAIVVDAAYGWGTLVHEMVHAYMDADFPEAPVWLEEGVASLFENSAPRPDDTIRGTTNWRLSRLQGALARSTVPSFVALAKAGRSAFHGDDGDLYYATARYLCFWLQEQGLLERFYREHRRRKGDGLDVLRQVTGMETTMLRSAWESFVLALSYERSGKVAGQ